jgi:solute:Na+ symporter, SSS family
MASRWWVWMRMGLAVVITLLSGAQTQEKAIDLEEIDFSTTTGFNLASLAVVLILIALYATWW